MKYTGTKTELSQWLHVWVKKRSDIGINIQFRQYQEDAVWAFISGDYKKFVLAASQCAGKNLITIMILDFYYSQIGPTFRAVVSAHNLVQLREQFIAEMVHFDADCLKNPECIIVGLPNLLKKNLMKKIHLFIVDEGHHYYGVFDGMVQKAIENMNPERQLILTGTPSYFNDYNNKPDNTDKFGMHFISMETLWLHGDVIHPAKNILVEVASTTCKFELSDYIEDELKTNITYTEKEMKETLYGLMHGIMNRLGSTLKNKPIEYKAFEMSFPERVFWVKSVGKTMFACHSQKQARLVKNILVNHFGYNENSVMLSISDESDSNLSAFVTEPEIKFLIVVFRGILGFNAPNLENIIDLTGSRNVNRLWQLFGRIIRPSEIVMRKFYYKVVPNHLVTYFEDLMAGVLHLGKEDYLRMFDGKNFHNLSIIPNRRRQTNENNDEQIGSSTNQQIIPRQLDLELIFNLNKLWHKGETPLDSSAYITLQRAMEYLNMVQVDITKLTTEELHEYALKIRAEWKKKK
jgi:superfamily II DNA or RNA helicase